MDSKEAILFHSLDERWQRLSKRAAACFYLVHKGYRSHWDQFQKEINEEFSSYLIELKKADWCENTEELLWLNQKQGLSETDEQYKDRVAQRLRRSNDLEIQVRKKSHDVAVLTCWLRRSIGRAV